MKKELNESRVLRNEEVSPNIFELELSAPLIYNKVQPGQFVHICVINNPVQMLRMPFCVYDIDYDFQTITICYYISGQGTKQLSEQEMGDVISVIGPLGQGWSIPKNATRALLVGGGLGATSQYLLAKRLYSLHITTDIVFGTANKSSVFCKEHMNSIAVNSGGSFFVSTIDGSFGYKGLCTDISNNLLDTNLYDYVSVCGPRSMEVCAIKKVLEKDICCEVSLEQLMACGVGVCLTCIVDTVQGRKRCCVDGPVFNAKEVIW